MKWSIIWGIVAGLGIYALFIFLDHIHFGTLQVSSLNSSAALNNNSWRILNPELIGGMLGSASVALLSIIVEYPKDKWYTSDKINIFILSYGATCIAIGVPIIVITREWLYSIFIIVAGFSLYAASMYLIFTKRKLLKL